MSEENVELVRASFDQTRRRDDPIPRVKYFGPEVEFDEDPRLPEAGLYRGVQEVRPTGSSSPGTSTIFTIEPEDFVEIGGSRVLVPLMITTRGRGSSASVTMQIAWIFTVRDHLITRIEPFADRQDPRSRRAAGVGDRRVGLP